MAGSAAKVVISERQEKALRKLSTATTVAKRLVQRATIILLAFSGVANPGHRQAGRPGTLPGRHLEATLAGCLR